MCVCVCNRGDNINVPRVIPWLGSQNTVFIVCNINRTKITIDGMGLIIFLRFQSRPPKKENNTNQFVYEQCVLRKTCFLFICVAQHLCEYVQCKNNMTKVLLGLRFWLLQNVNKAESEAGF